MSQDNVSVLDLASKLPDIVGRLPSIAKGLYYYSKKDKTRELTLGVLIERNASNYGRRAAIYYEDRVITWSELNDWANRIAQFLQSQGLTKGDTIAVLLENRPELLAVVVGAAKIGVGCAMLNTSQKGRVLEHSINLVEPKQIVVGEEMMDSFMAVRSGLKLTHPNPLLFVADANTLATFGDTPEGFINFAEKVSTFNSRDLKVTDEPVMGTTALYIFTSGTTGLPKAAPGSHVKFVKAYGGFGLLTMNMKPEDILYCTLPFYHATALIVCWGSVIAGGSAIVMRRKFSATAFWDDVRHYNATCFGYVGELCRYLLNQPPSDQDRKHPMVKMIGNGLRPSIWTSFKERFGIERVCEIYASSEGNIGFSNFFNIDNTVGFSTAPYKLVKFHQGTRDPKRNEEGFLEEAEKGEPGLLLGEITPKWDFEGYTQKEATEKSIVRDGFKKGDKWFNTGDVLKDLGFRHLQFVDRMGDTFRWKGENVSTTEVENIIDGSGMSEEAIVYGVEIPKHSGKAGMVTLVPRDNFEISAFFKFLQENLPPYAIPVFIRVTDRIEKTGTFKYRKVDMQKTAYHLEGGSDQVYALTSKKEGYSLIDSEAEKKN